jgi:hypothetical protein
MEYRVSEDVTQRQKFTRVFLWISVLAWGVLVGAKLFDLRVLVGAWSASPPESLGMLPYGPHWPVDTGEFFIPSSAALLVATLGALTSGWRTPARYRIWLAVSLATIFGVLILTVTEFWPMNAALWAVARSAPNAIHDRDAIAHLVRRWVAMDCVRVSREQWVLSRRFAQSASHTSRKPRLGVRRC